jgi:hypothetical protein
VSEEDKQTLGEIMEFLLFLFVSFVLIVVLVAVVCYHATFCFDALDNSWQPVKPLAHCLG